jgi:hypothetical protein
VEVVRLTRPRQVIPIHTGGWTHFREGAEELRRAFEAAGFANRLRLPEAGWRLELG